MEFWHEREELRMADTHRRTLAEALDAAETGDQFAEILAGLFNRRNDTTEDQEQQQ